MKFGLELHLDKTRLVDFRLYLFSALAPPILGRDLCSRFPSGCWTIATPSSLLRKRQSPGSTHCAVGLQGLGCGTKDRMNRLCQLRGLGVQRLVVVCTPHLQIYPDDRNGSVMRPRRTALQSDLDSLDPNRAVKALRL